MFGVCMLDPGGWDPIGQIKGLIRTVAPLTSMADTPLGELRHSSGLHTVMTEGRAEGASSVDRVLAMPEVDLGQPIRILLAPVPAGQPASTFVAGTVDAEGEFSPWGRLVVGRAPEMDGFRLHVLNTDPPEEGDTEFERGVDPAAVEGVQFEEGCWTGAGDTVELSPTRPQRWTGSVPAVSESTGWQDDGGSGEF